MESPTLIQRLKIPFKQKREEPEYQPVHTECIGTNSNDEIRRPVLVLPDDDSFPDEKDFSWLQYSVFVLLGISMLWAWNMFLSAAPYFQFRFAENRAILARFQSAIISISCTTNLSCTIILTQLQSKANYPRRIKIGLAIFFVIFSLLSISTKYFLGVSTEGYFAFTLITVFFTSIGTGLCQNGTFAFATSIGRPEYIQAIVTGQGIAGVLPSLAQIVSVLAIPDPDESATAFEKARIIAKGSSSAALSYFITATFISIVTFVTSIPLIRKHSQIPSYDLMDSSRNSQETQKTKRQVVSMRVLYKKLGWLAASIFLCLATSMFFPVFTARIVSVVPEDKAPLILHNTVFIPLGFLCWNMGDLAGRLTTLSPIRKWRIKQRSLFFFVCLRFVFIPLYFLCNLGGHGAKINSDIFYLIIVSFGFGFTNGILSSLCLMNAGKYVDLEEREATGGFMVMNLLAGLTVGSLLSFAVSDVGT
ncbi:Nucleoside transporter [Erysiphe necator]|nr:Nucleoside transporter [Erysiphe necator]